MKKFIFSVLIACLIFTSFSVNARYLMDPMPNQKVAPSFNLIGMDEKFHTLDEFKGKFVLVNFWATWCHPCKEEMPTLESIHKRMDNNKFIVLGIHVGPDPTNIQDFLKTNPITFPIFIDMDLELDWGVPGLPTTFLIDPHGKMIYRAVGKRNFASFEMEDFFLKLIKDYSN